MDPLGGRLPQLGEKLILQSGQLVLSVQDGVLHLLQLGGDVPLAVHQRLFADVGIGDLPGVAFGDLDVIAEHLIKPYFQGFDTGFLLLLGLHGGHHVPSAGEDAPQPVHLLVVALPDKAALPDGEGGFLHKGGIDGPP